MSSWSSAMHFVSETSIIIVSVMHRLTTTAKLDSSPHLIYLRHRTLWRLKPKPNTYEGDPSLSVGSFDCGGQNQNSELDSIMGRGRKAPIHKKSGTNLVSPTATLGSLLLLSGCACQSSWPPLAPYVSRKIYTFIQVSSFKKSVHIETHTPSQNQTF